MPWNYFRSVVERTLDLEGTVGRFIPTTLPRKLANTPGVKFHKGFELAVDIFWTLTWFVLLFDFRPRSSGTFNSNFSHKEGFPDYIDGAKIEIIADNWIELNQNILTTSLDYDACSPHISISSYLDSLGSFTGVLEVNTKVWAFCFTALGCIFRLNGVSSHYPIKVVNSEIYTDGYWVFYENTVK